MSRFETTIGNGDARRAFIGTCIKNLEALQNQNLCCTDNSAPREPEKTYYRNCIDLLCKIRDDPAHKNAAKQVLVVLFFYFYTNHTDEYFDSFVTNPNEVNRCIYDTVRVSALDESMRSKCDRSAEYHVWSHLYERVLETVEGNSKLARVPKTAREEHNVRMQHPLRLAAELLTRTHSVWGASTEYNL